LGPFIEIGALGWLHEGWQDQFYPDELPEDWQLSYYANEFRFVVIPCDQWMRAEQDEMEQWLDDVHDQFSFFAEINHASLETGRLQLEQLLNVMGERFAGLVYRDSVDALAGDISVLQELNSIRSVHVDVPGAEGMEIIKQGDLHPCWRQGDEFPVQAGGLGFIPRSDDLANQRELRKILQSFLSNAANTGDFFMVFEGNPPHVGAMQDAVVIAELLGV
jgi:uncharacterized protein YecE (DUF72 family)